MVEKRPVVPEVGSSIDPVDSGRRIPKVTTKEQENAKTDAIKAFLAFYSKYSESVKGKRTADRLGREMKTFLENMRPPFAFQQPGLDAEGLSREDAFLSTLSFLKDIGACPSSLPVLFTSVLQRLLCHLGVNWPAGVFRENPMEPGSGRTPSPHRARAILMKREGNGISDIAKDIFPDLYKKNSKQARDRVRSLLRSA